MVAAHPGTGDIPQGHGGRCHRPAPKSPPWGQGCARPALQAISGSCDHQRGHVGFPTHCGVWGGIFGDKLKRAHPAEQQDEVPGGSVQRGRPGKQRHAPKNALCCSVPRCSTGPGACRRHAARRPALTAQKNWSRQSAVLGRHWEHWWGGSRDIRERFSAGSRCKKWGKKTQISASELLRTASSPPSTREEEGCVLQAPGPGRG